MIHVDEPEKLLINDLRTRIDERLGTIVDPTFTGPLYDAVRFALSGQGKRLRPILTVLSGALFGAGDDETLQAALAMEVFHTFTLVHDDIMDRSSVRRGRETVHVKWDEPTAILVGDLMLAMTYDLLVDSNPRRIKDIFHVYSDTVRALCEGQISDMQFESRSDVSVDEYLEMIDHKTGRLLSTCLEMGGLYGNATDEDLTRLRELGTQIGRAFQIQDDLLDLVATDSAWGKPIGGDLISGKQTFLLVTAIERSSGGEKDWWRNVVASGNLLPEQVADARNRLDKLGVLDSAQMAVADHGNRADRLIALLPDTKAREPLRYVVDALKKRKY